MVLNALLHTWRMIKGKRSGRMPTSFRDFSAESNCKNFCHVSQETCIAQNARLPSTEAFPAYRRLYEGYGDWAEMEGWFFRQIAADTNRDVSTVHRLWRRWLAQGNVARSRCPGAVRVTSALEDRRNRLQAVASPQATSPSILQHVQDTLDVQYRPEQFSRRLVESGLHSRRPLRKLALTPQRRHALIEWCRARVIWMTELRNVVFSDESRFCFFNDSLRIRVWRRRGERFNPAVTVERPTARQRGIMVWGAIVSDSTSPLVRIQGTLNAQRYVQNVLRPVEIPYLQGCPTLFFSRIMPAHTMPVPLPLFPIFISEFCLAMKRTSG
ncbi:transposable element Tcb1 transposase [Trichonephila clavipes]|nr:transposable element Tcb1 transposase [Trichonephila clavipes]